MKAVKRTRDEFDKSQKSIQSDDEVSEIQKSFRKKIDLNPLPSASHILDRIKLDTKCEEFEKIFDKLAEEIINEYEYVAGGKSLRFREIEFYVQHPNLPDPCAYIYPDLNKMGGWYFHKVGKSYAGGTRKGHGITFGSENHVAGILVRSLEDQGKIIDGCSLCVDYILKLCRKMNKEIKGVPQLVASRRFSNDVLDKSAPIFIRKMTGEITKFKYYKCPRVGLGDKYPEYRDKLYRYLVLPAKVKKGRDGVIRSLLKEGYEPTKIKELTGCLLTTVNKIANLIPK